MCDTRPMIYHKTICNWVITIRNVILSMNIRNTSGMLALTVVATLAIASVTGFQLGEAENNDKGYTFGEDVKVTAKFKFPDGSEIAQFEVFNQIQGFDKQGKGIFEVRKVAGSDTPMLNHYTEIHRAGYFQNLLEKSFDVDVMVAQGGDVIKKFDYDTCKVSDNTIATEYDKEEGWMGKGFVHVETFEITCNKYWVQNTAYDAMMEDEYMKDKPTASGTYSSLDYEKAQQALQNRLGQQ